MDKAKRTPPETLQEVGVLLEDISTQLSAVAEGVVGNTDHIEQLEKTVKDGFARLETEIAIIRTIIGTPQQPKLITLEEHAALEKRVRKIEEALAAQGNATNH